MKPNHQLLLILGIYLLTISPSQAQKNKIIGKWKPDMKIMKYAFMNALEKDKEGIEERLNIELTPDNMRIMTESFSQLTMEFNTDGTYYSHYRVLFTGRDHEEKGIWIFESDQITAKLGENQREEKYKVIKLTKNKLVFVLVDELRSPLQEFTMKRVK